MYFLKLTVSIKLISTHIYVFESKKHVWTSSQLFFSKDQSNSIKNKYVFYNSRYRFKIFKNGKQQV